MFRYKFVIDTGYVGAIHEDIFEYDKKPTQTRLDEDMEIFIHENIECGYYEVDEDDNEVSI